MSPDELDDLILAYISGTLDEAGRQSLEQALTNDRKCGRRFAELCLQENLLETIGQTDAISDDMSKRRPSIRGLAANSRRSRRKPRSRFNFIAWASGLAAAILAVVALVYIFNSSKRSNAPEPQAATIIEVQGTATIQTRTAKTGMRLVAGESLTTMQDSGVDLRYADGTAIQVGANSELVLADNKNSRQKLLNLMMGEISASVAKQANDEPFIVTTPHAKVKVVGTQFTLMASLGSTRLDVAEGSVRIVRVGDNASDGVQVSAGEFAIASPGTPLVARKNSTQPLFATDFERGDLSGFSVPSINPWQIVSDPDGNTRVLAGGTTTAEKRVEDGRYAIALLCGQASWTDYAVQVSVRFKAMSLDRAGVHGAMVLARVKDPKNLYWLEYSVKGPAQSDGALQDGKPFLSLWKRVNGQDQLLTGKTTSAIPMPSTSRWYKLRLEVQGTRLRGVLDGQVMLEAEDTDFKAGPAGITRADSMATDNVIFWDDMKVEQLTR